MLLWVSNAVLLADCERSPVFILPSQQGHCTTNKLSTMGASLTAMWKRHLKANLDWIA
jgi:hypothetical protein